MEMSSDRIACVACKHEIDASAKLCPFCGADPRTGEKLDTEALLQSEFSARKPLTASENVLEYARQRQGVVVAFAIAAGVLLLVGLHQFATRRNERHVSSATAVPLTEVTDIGGQDENQPPPPMPELQFQHEGNPQTMRTFVVEGGAVTPPEVVAAQQAAAAAKQQQATPPATQPLVRR
jgi:RNA polymerase subunit RPABC4/transcription elongation factor Spt4